MVIAIALLAVFTALMLVLWLTERARANRMSQAIPMTPEAEQATAQKKATEVKNAPSADISARIEQLRARGRSGK